jgi:hypothetical protein
MLDRVLQDPFWPFGERSFRHLKFAIRLAHPKVENNRMLKAKARSKLTYLSSGELQSKARWWLQVFE